MVVHFHADSAFLLRGAARKAEGELNHHRIPIPYLECSSIMRPFSL